MTAELYQPQSLATWQRSFSPSPPLKQWIILTRLFQLHVVVNETSILFPILILFLRCLQNRELPLEFVHSSLKTKTFLLHIKPVQAQLADARQRYTVLHYSELGQEIDSAQLIGQPDALPISAEHRAQTAQLLTPGWPPQLKFYQIASYLTSIFSQSLFLQGRVALVQRLASALLISLMKQKLLPLMTLQLLLRIATRGQNWAESPLSPLGRWNLDIFCPFHLHFYMQNSGLFVTFECATHITINLLPSVNGHLLNSFCIIIQH